MRRLAPIRTELVISRRLFCSTIRWPRLRGSLGKSSPAPLVLAPLTARPLLAANRKYRETLLSYVANSLSTFSRLPARSTLLPIHPAIRRANEPAISRRREFADATPFHSHRQQPGSPSWPLLAKEHVELLKEMFILEESARSHRRAAWPRHRSFLSLPAPGFYVLFRRHLP